MLGHMLYESLRSSFAFWILTVEVNSTPLRLAGVPGHRRRREWSLGLRTTIADPSMPWVGVGEVPIAGGKPVSVLGILSDEIAVLLSFKDKDPPLKCGNHC